MTQTVTTDGAVTADTEFPQTPNVQPVFVEGRTRQVVLLFNESYTNQTTGFSTAMIDTSRYRAIHLVVEWISATGTSPTLQIDLNQLLPNGDWFDYYNNGTHTSSFTYDIGPGLYVSSMVPPAMRLGVILGGTTPSITFNLYVWGEL
jgi:hypothetical protein